MGQPFVRLIWVVAAFAPLFLLWAIRGNPPAEAYVGVWGWISICLLLAIVPNAAVIAAITLAAHSSALPGTEIPAEVRPTGEQLVAFLLAMLLPLYDANISAVRDAAALVVAVAIVVVVFWFAGLHVLNLAVAAMRYRVWMVRWRRNAASSDAAGEWVFLLTRASDPPTVGEPLRVRTVLNSVFVEAK